MQYSEVQNIAKKTIEFIDILSRMTREIFTFPILHKTGFLSICHFQPTFLKSKRFLRTIFYLLNRPSTSQRPFSSYRCQHFGRYIPPHHLQAYRYTPRQTV